MAAKKRSGVNRSAFIREILNGNPNAKLSDVQEAWQSEGHEGEITGTLYYQVKKQMGLSSRRRRRGRPAGSKNKTTQASSSNGGGDARSTYADIEKTLDKLVQQAVELKDNSLGEDLRVARRRVSSKLV